MTVVTRFAPSPTGDLHVGSVRTALFSWLYAKKNKGEFILRIEDTDLERSTQAAIQIILDGMGWLGLTWDQGPFYQTQRFPRYLAVANQLVEQGLAYRCTCSKERLETLRETQMAQKQKPQYDGHCRDKHIQADSALPFVIRFKTPTEGSTTVHDVVHGPVTVEHIELDDLIIVRSDGSPTYNFCVCIDDYDMKVTHVIRGDDHLNNTFRQVHIFQALNAPIPTYAHVPMILGEDGKKLSKRHGAVSVLQFREEGYLPQALLNYLVRLGWSYGDQEIFSMEEMITHFDITGLNKGAAALNTSKLQWINQHYLKTLPHELIIPELQWHFERQGVDTGEGPDLRDVIDSQKERAKTLVEMVEKSMFLYKDVEDIDESLFEKHFTAQVSDALHTIQKELKTLKNWEKEDIHTIIADVAEAFSLKLGSIAQPIRIAVTGGTVSPPLDVTLFLLGQEKTVARLGQALSKQQAL